MASATLADNAAAWWLYALSGGLSLVDCMVFLSSSQHELWENLRTTWRGYIEAIPGPV